MQDGVHFVLRDAGDRFRTSRVRLHSRVEVLERLRALGILDGVIPQRVIRVIEARRCSRKQERESLSEEIRFALDVFIERFQSRRRPRDGPNKAYEIRRGVLHSRHGQSRRFFTNTRIAIRYSTSRNLSTHDCPETHQSGQNLHVVDARNDDERDESDEHLRRQANESAHGGAETTSQT